MVAMAMGALPFALAWADRQASSATDSTTVYRTEGAKATLAAQARMMQGGFDAFFPSGRQIATTCTEHILPRVVLHEPAYGKQTYNPPLCSPRVHRPGYPLG